ncbi:MAG: rRNA methyltransferase [Gemmatimonadetes bacterium]|nr:rRNA methyltransferase [Gemmatimonadota bacterium]
MPAGDVTVERFRAARRDPALVVLEGFHALKHALRFGAEILEAVSADPEALHALAQRLAPDVAQRIATCARPVEPELFRRLAPVPPPTGVIALARRPQLRPEALVASDAPEPVVVLERPAHLGNLGAAVRVAAAAGAAGVLSTGPHDPWQPEAVRGSAGLHFALPVARIDEVPMSDRPLVAIDPGGEPLRPGTLPARALLVLGSERDGIEAATLARADLRVGIPMRPGVSSLNLATAVAVVLYSRVLDRA